MKHRLTLFLSGMNRKFVACFKSKKMFYKMVSCLIYKNFKVSNISATKNLMLITRLFITLNSGIVLLIAKLCCLVKFLLKKFSSLITCRRKSSCRLKRCNLKFIVVTKFLFISEITSLKLHG